MQLKVVLEVSDMIKHYQVSSQYNTLFQTNISLLYDNYDNGFMTIMFKLFMCELPITYPCLDEGNCHDSIIYYVAVI